MRRRHMKAKPRGPLRDNSRSLSIRMTEEEYQLLQSSLKLTRMRSSIYFRHLIWEDHLKGRSQDLNHALHASLNKIYSNVRQMTRHQRAQELDMDSVRRIEFLMDALCEEIYLLTSHQ